MSASPLPSTSATAGVERMYAPYEALGGSSTMRRLSLPSRPSSTTISPSNTVLTMRVVTMTSGYMSPLTSPIAGIAWVASVSHDHSSTSSRSPKSGMISQVTGSWLGRHCMSVGSQNWPSGQS